MSNEQSAPRTMLPGKVPTAVKVVSRPKRRHVYVDGEIDGDDLILLLIDREHYLETENERVIRRIRIPNALLEESDDTDFEVV